MADNGYAQPEPKGRFNWHVRRAPKGPRRLAVKNHFVAMIGEYVGTCLFMIFALGGTNVANIPTTNITGKTTEGQDGTQATAANTSNLLYIALSFGFSLAVNAWVFFRVSGGLFNPAVSLGMALVGALTPLRAALLTVSQILGGITGAALIQALLPGTLNVRTTLSPGTSVVRGLFIEMFLTAMLMLTILLLAAEKTKATFLAPIGIGLALFVAELLGVYYTGGSLNPARSFGPCVVLTDFESYHWIYWLGPALGAVVAAGFYRLLKFLEYETVLGPDADAEHQDHPDAQHEHDPERDTNGHAHNGHAAVAPELAAPGPLLLGGPVSRPNASTRASNTAGRTGTGTGVVASASAPAALSNSNAHIANGRPNIPTNGSAARDSTTAGGTGMNILGPGLGDLLTGVPAVRDGGVFHLSSSAEDGVVAPGRSYEYEERLGRIENMLQMLLTRAEGTAAQGQSSVGSVPAGHHTQTRAL